MRDPAFRALATRSASAVWDVAYALFNLALAFAYQSFWFVSMAAYYVVLGALGGYALRCGARPGEAALPAVSRRCGYGVLALAVAVSGVVCMCIAETRNSSYHIVVMIALAAYAFYSATSSIVGAVRARRGDGCQRILRKLSLASTIGSMLSPEFSMLGTFGDPADSFSFAMEAASGAVAVALLLILGRSLIVQARSGGVHARRG